MEIGLDAGAVLGIDARKKHLVVRCVAGCLYLTRTGDPRDYFLRPGEQMEFAPRDRVLIEGWGAARLQCMNGTDAQVQRPNVSAWHLS